MKANLNLMDTNFKSFEDDDLSNSSIATNFTTDFLKHIFKFKSL